MAFTAAAEHHGGGSGITKGNGTFRNFKIGGITVATIGTPNLAGFFVKGNLWLFVGKKSIEGDSWAGNVFQFPSGAVESFLVGFGASAGFRQKYGKEKRRIEVFIL